jgi:cation diffusion facilitator family transporter
MHAFSPEPAASGHDHVFLGAGHQGAERRTWAVIWLCAAMMLAEIAGGWLFGSIALIADGLHMSTHAGALLLAALAYRYARRHATDPRFTFGTGKFGDLAGFTSAIVLAMISVLIGYEAVGRLFAPVSIRFAEAIPIACLGLAVNIASVWLLSGDHDHHHGHGHHGNGHDDSQQKIVTQAGTFLLSIFEDGVPPRFRLAPAPKEAVVVETIRPDGARQLFNLLPRGNCLESGDEIPEPHAFAAEVRIGDASHHVHFAELEHAHEAAGRDNNMRAAIIHVMADAAVSLLVIAGLLLARGFGWLWMDPLAGLAGAVVIASWSWGLVRDTGAILLDMCPDRRLAERLRGAVEAEGDRLSDLHVWRLGPGHLGAILCVDTIQGRDAAYYRGRLTQFRDLSHLTIEVHQRA